MKPSILLSTLLAATSAATFAAELSGTVIAAGSNDTYDLPVLGALDWAFWNTGANPAPGTPTVSMAGAALIGDMAPYSGGNLRGSTAPTQPTANFIHADGAVAANITGLFNTTLNTTGVGTRLDVTLPGTETYQIIVWTSGFTGATRLTATLGSEIYSSPGEDVNTGGKPTFAHILTATPDSAGQVLQIRNELITSTNNSSHAIISAVAVSVKSTDSDGDGLTDAQELILGLNPLVSDADFITAVRNHPHFFGLYSETGILGLSQGGIVLPDSGNGTVDLKLELQSGPDLQAWPGSTPIERSIPLPAGANFLRITLEQP